MNIRTVRSLGNIGAQNASSLGAEEDAGVGGLGDVSQVGVVVGVQGALEGASLVEVGIFSNVRSCVILLQWLPMEEIWVEHTVADATTATEVLNSSLATSNVLVLKTTSLQLRSALSKAARLNR